jgi:transposase InsO family protein
MRSMGLQGVIRGKRVRTTIADKATPCPRDHVNRQFRASRPNVLWVSDFIVAPGSPCSAYTRMADLRACSPYRPATLYVPRG